VESAFVGGVLALIASIVLPAFEHPGIVLATVSAHEKTFIALSLAVAAVIGGPYFRNFPHRDRSHLAERLVKSTIAGCSVPAAIWLVVWICVYPEQIKTFRDTWHALVKFEYSGTATAALLLGLLGAFVVNFLSDYYGTAVVVAEQSGDYLLSLCFKAVQTAKPITFVLSNRRAYTGYVVLSPNLKPESQVSIILAVQGYMEKESSKLKWEASYLPEWEKDAAKAKSFIVIIPTRLIDHAHLATEPLNQASGVVSAAEIPVKGSLRT
jgi:hypothetical protein